MGIKKIKDNHHISLLLLTKNQEGNITKYFDWLDRCTSINEIIVADECSTDNTIKSLKFLENKYRKVKIYSPKIEDDFSAKRTYALKNCTNDWIFWLDADEKPNEDLIQFLDHIDKHQCNVYSFKRRDFFFTQELKHGENGHSKFVRLFNKNYGSFIGRVHEVWKTNQPVVDTNLVISHYPHQSIKSLMEKINFYSDIRAKELFDQKIETNVFEIIFYPVAKFFQNYIFKLGFLDSTAGMVMALTMSFHSFLVRSKLWQLHHP